MGNSAEPYSLYLYFNNKQGIDTLTFSTSFTTSNYQQKRNKKYKYLEIESANYGISNSDLDKSGGPTDYSRMLYYGGSGLRNLSHINYQIKIKDLENNDLNLWNYDKEYLLDLTTEDGGVYYHNNTDSQQLHEIQTSLNLSNNVINFGLHEEYNITTRQHSNPTISRHLVRDFHDLIRPTKQIKEFSKRANFGVHEPRGAFTFENDATSNWDDNNWYSESNAGPVKNKRKSVFALFPYDTSATNTPNVGSTVSEIQITMPSLLSGLNTSLGGRDGPRLQLFSIKLIDINNEEYTLFSI